MITIKRMWINQPSTHHFQHKLHGTNVLAVEEWPGTMRVYFTSGPVVSMQMSPLELSEGWVRNNNQETGHDVCLYGRPL
jgi:hypothetical protein